MGSHLLWRQLAGQLVHSVLERRLLVQQRAVLLEQQPGIALLLAFGNVRIFRLGLLYAERWRKGRRLLILPELVRPAHLQVSLQDQVRSPTSAAEQSPVEVAP